MIICCTTSTYFSTYLSIYIGFNCLNGWVFCIGIFICFNIYRFVFFIFFVSNLGGLLTPIGDPPLFMGFLKGVPFFWTTQNLLLPWLLAMVSLSTVFYFFEKRNTLDTASVFAGLLTVMAVGLIIEAVIFRIIEAKTVRRWGMQRG